MILQEAASAVIAKDDVQLAVRTKSQDAAIVIAARRLTRILLQRTQLDQIAIERERRSIPDVTIDAVSEKRHLSIFAVSDPVLLSVQ